MADISFIQAILRKTYNYILFENMIQSYFYSTNVNPLPSLCVKCDLKQKNEAVSVKFFFSKLYYPQSVLFVKYNICLKTLLQQGI